VNKIVRPFGRRELLELLVLASHCRRHLLVQRIQAVDFFSISDLRSQTCVYMLRREYRDHTVPSGLLHCVYTVHHAHILLVYSITPHSTPASHSTPLHTPPLYSLIHVDPRWPGAASTLSAARLHAVLVCWARPSPPMLCAGAGW